MSRATVLESKGLVKTYHDGTRELRILRGVDLRVNEGEILAISGVSGVGKSTLLHLIGTLDQPTAGEIFFRGTSLNRMRRGTLNRIRNEEKASSSSFTICCPSSRRSRTS